MGDGSGRLIIVDCPGCGGARVRAEVVGHVANDPADIDVWQVVELAKCPACDGPLVAVHAAELSGQDYDGDYLYDRTDPVRVWPDPPRHLHSLAPPPVLADLDEARKCLSVGAFNATAVMARRVLEGLVDGQGAEGRTLHDKLQYLATAGAIDPRLAEWADALRVVGNQGAHGGPPATREDASDALAFAEAVADYLYTFRLRFDEFLARRSDDESEEQK